MVAARKLALVIAAVGALGSAADLWAQQRYVAQQPRSDQPADVFTSKPIQAITPALIMPKAGAELPPERTVPTGVAAPRDWQTQCFHWQASGLRHYPLYFEDLPLERYGHSLGHLQPLWSTGQFYVQVLAWPYNMGLNPPHCPLYTLGHDRPGDCTPRLWYQIPINAQAVAAQAATLTLVPVIFP